MTAQTEDWWEDYAYTLGVQAYIFGYPWLHLARLRWRSVSAGDPTTAPAVNGLRHDRELPNPAHKEGASPTRDTLQSIGWLALEREPLVLSVPSAPDRYFALQVAGMDSDTVAYVGTRATGTASGHYLIAGPHWNGVTPEGVVPLPRARTNSALIVGRTWVDGPEDLNGARTMQEAMRLAPLSQWQTAGAEGPWRPSTWRPIDGRDDTLADWLTMNRAMTENPPDERHAPLVRLFATVGVGPQQRVELTPLATRRGLVRAAQSGPNLLACAHSSGKLGRNVNGWCYPPRTIGRAGLCDDFLTRSGAQCIGCVVANDGEESMALRTWVDVSGEPLSGAHRYAVHFPGNDLPPVRACWTLSMYDEDDNFVLNARERYSIGSRTSSLQRDADGGLTVYLQPDAPDAEHEANWLPAPRERFHLMLRAYIPREPLTAQTWTPPAVEPLR